MKIGFNISWIELRVKGRYFVMFFQAHHKKTMFYLEQLILKHKAHQACTNIKAVHGEGWTRPFLMFKLSYIAFAKSLKSLSLGNLNKFFAETSFGLWVLLLPLSVCLWVCVSVSLFVYQSQACPADNSSPVQARATKFGQTMQNTLVQIPIVFRLIELNLIGQI